MTKTMKADFAADTLYAERAAILLVAAKARYNSARAAKAEADAAYDSAREAYAKADARHAVEIAGYEEDSAREAYMEARVAVEIADARKERS